MGFTVIKSARKGGGGGGGAQGVNALALNLLFSFKKFRLTDTKVKMRHSNVQPSQRK